MLEYWVENAFKHGVMVGLAYGIVVVIIIKLVAAARRKKE